MRAGRSRQSSSLKLFGEAVAARSFPNIHHCFITKTTAARIHRANERAKESERVIKIVSAYLIEVYANSVDSMMWCSECVRERLERGWFGWLNFFIFNQEPCQRIRCDVEHEFFFFLLSSLMRPLCIDSSCLFVLAAFFLIMFELRALLHFERVCRARALALLSTYP